MENPSALSMLGTVRRPGFPAEGQHVVIRQDGCEVASGWFSVSPTAAAGGERVSAVVVSADMRVWRGLVSRDQIELPEYNVNCIAPEWFSTLTFYVHSVEQVQGELERKRQWLDDLVSDAHEWADDNSLCEKFDEFMDEHDLPTRSKDHQVRVRISASIWVTRSARDYGDAASAVDTDDVIERLEELGITGVSGHHIEWETD